MLCQEMNDFHFLSQESCMTGAFACFQSGLRTCFAITYLNFFEEMSSGYPALNELTEKFCRGLDKIVGVIYPGRFVWRMHGKLGQSDIDSIDCNLGVRYISES